MSADPSSDPPSDLTSRVPRFHGIVCPLITPLHGRDDLDTEGLERLIEHVLEGGVSGVFILGTTGEAPSLSYRLRRQLITRTCRFVKGRVPVLVGITDTAFIESVNLSRSAADAGADAVVLALPYYFPTGQAELTEYIRHLTPDLPLPVMLYNMPSLTKVWFEVDTLRQLADMENIVGVKDSSGDMGYFARVVGLRASRPDWSLLAGPEHLLAQSLELGGDGGVNGGANVVPRLFFDCWEAVTSGDGNRAAALQDRIMEFQAIYSIGKYESRFIKAIKCACSILGICDDYLADPFHRFRETERQKVKQVLDSFARDTS